MLGTGTNTNIPRVLYGEWSPRPVIAIRNTYIPVCVENMASGDKKWSTCWSNQVHNGIRDVFVWCNANYNTDYHLIHSSGVYPSTVDNPGLCWYRIPEITRIYRMHNLKYRKSSWTLGHIPLLPPWNSMPHQSACHWGLIFLISPLEMWACWGMFRNYADSKTMWASDNSGFPGVSIRLVPGSSALQFGIQSAHVLTLVWKPV